MKKKLKTLVVVMLNLCIIGSTVSGCKPKNEPSNSGPETSTSDSTTLVTESTTVEDTTTESTDSTTVEDTTTESTDSTSENSNSATTKKSNTNTPSGGNDKVDPKGFVIVRGVKATRIEKKAATDLQEYLNKITGQKFEIITDDKAETAKEFIVGATTRKHKIDKNKLKDDGFAVVIKDNKIALQGATDASTIYAVYHFLEEYLGCRYYAPGVERIPTSKTLDLPANINDVQNPILAYRDVDWKSTNDTVFAAKMRINSDHNRRVSASYGRGVHYAAGEFVHTFNFLLPPTKYFSAHPEYYSKQPNGNRTTDQPCLSNPQVINIITQNVLETLKKDPTSDIISVSQNDNKYYCTCDNCTKIANEEGSQSGPIIRLVNHVAAEVKKSYPNVKVDTLAYMYSRKPSKTKPADNVIIRLCSFECCFSHALNDSSCSVNREFASDVTAWKQKTNNIYIWDYTTNFDYYPNTFPDFRVLQKNIQFFVNNNVKGIFEQGNGNVNGEFGELRAYLLAKLLWNPNANVDALMNDFLQGYYGSGWNNIKTYIDKYQDLITKLGTHATIYLDPRKMTPIDNSLTKAFINEGEGLWNAAEKGVSGVALDNVKRSRIQYTYLKQIVNSGNKTAAWKAANKALLDSINHYGVALREHPTTAEIYINQSPELWKK